MRLRFVSSLRAGIAAGAVGLGLLTTVPLVHGQSEKVDAAGIFKLRCAMCHGAKGDSKLPGMSFADGEWKHGTTAKELANVIRNGVTGTAMLPFKSKLSDAEIEALARFVRTFDPKLKADAQ